MGSAKPQPNLTTLALFLASKWLKGARKCVVSGLRYYSPELGRWLNRDPIGEKGGIAVNGFCGNSAVGRIDILGLSISSTPAGRFYLMERIINLTAFADQLSDTASLHAPETPLGFETGFVPIRSGPKACSKNAVKLVQLMKGGGQGMPDEWLVDAGPNREPGGDDTVSERNFKHRGGISVCRASGHLHDGQGLRKRYGGWMAGTSVDAPLRGSERQVMVAALCCSSESNSFKFLGVFGFNYVPEQGVVESTIHGGVIVKIKQAQTERIWRVDAVPTEPAGWKHALQEWKKGRSRRKAGKIEP